MFDEKKLNELDDVHKKHDKIMAKINSIKKNAPKLLAASFALTEFLSTLVNHTLVEKSLREAHENAPETQDRIHTFLFYFIENQKLSLKHYNTSHTDFDWSQMNMYNYESVIHKFWREYPSHKGEYQGIINFAHNGVNEILNDYEHYSFSQSAVDMAPFSVLSSLAVVAITYAYPYYKAKVQREKLAQEIWKREDELFWDK